MKRRSNEEKMAFYDSVLVIATMKQALRARASGSGGLKPDPDEVAKIKNILRSTGQVEVVETPTLGSWDEGSEGIFKQFERLAEQLPDDYVPLAEPEVISSVVRQETRIDVIKDNEVLPTIEMNMPIYFAGKTYQLSGSATDHNYCPELGEIYNRAIMGSSWAENGHLFNQHSMDKIIVNPAKFSESGYQICAVYPWGRGDVAEINIEWRTEGDGEMTNCGGLSRSSSCRIFPVTEARVINGTKSIELLGGGYGILGKLADTPGIIWTQSGPLIRDGRNVETNSITKPGIESIKVDGNTDSLWDNRQWLNDNSRVASIAQAYKEICNGRSVIMPKLDLNNVKETVLVAQALAQMVAARYGKNIYWVTERGILEPTDRRVFNLVFTRERGVPEYIQNNVFVDPRSCRLTSENRDLVDKIKRTFLKPLPQALREWKSIV